MFDADKQALADLGATVHAAEEGGFWAEVPGMPGCASQGETLGELLTHLREAIEGWSSVDPCRGITFHPFVVPAKAGTQ